MSEEKIADIWNKLKPGDIIETNASGVGGVTLEDSFFTAKILCIHGGDMYIQDLREGFHSGDRCRVIGCSSQGQRSWAISKINREGKIRIKSSSSVMNNIIEFFKNMGLGAEEKAIKEAGLEDPIGTPTTKGLELSALISYKANRAEIIKVAQQMAAEKAKTEADKK